MRRVQRPQFHAIVSDSLHVCFECAFELRGPIHLNDGPRLCCWKCASNLHGPMLVVNWRCYEINNVDNGAYSIYRTSIGREFSIRLPGTVIMDRCYKPETRTAGLLFTPDQMLALAAFHTHPTFVGQPSTGSLDKWNPE